MHDVAKRTLALAVATGGLLITGAAPALSAVSHHPEDKGAAPGRGQSETGRPARDAAAIPVGGTTTAERHAHQRSASTRHSSPMLPASPEAHGAPAEHGAREARAAHAAGRHAAVPDEWRAPAGRHAAPAPGGRHAVPAPVVRDSRATSAPRAAPHDAPAAVPAAAAPAALPAVGLPDAPGIGGIGGGFLQDNTVEIPIHAPVNLCGLLVTVVGTHATDTGDSCVDALSVGGGANTMAGAATAGDAGIASGNVVEVPVSVPINGCGDIVDALSVGDTTQGILCVNEGTGGSFAHAAASTADSPGFVNGNIVQVPVDVPINVCGVTASVVGFSNKTSGTTCVNGDAPLVSTPGALAAGAASGSPGVGTGNIVQVPIAAPITVCGDTVNVVGVGNSTSGTTCANNVPGGSTAAGAAIDNTGAASGNLVQVPVNIPAEVCGITASVVGVANQSTGNACLGETGTTGSTASGMTSGETGLITGNVFQAPADNPVLVCGDAVGAVDVHGQADGQVCANGPGNPPPVTPPPGNPPPVTPPPGNPPPVTPPPGNPPPVTPPPVTPPPGNPPPVTPPPVTPPPGNPPPVTPPPVTPPPGNPPPVTPPPVTPPPGNPPPVTPPPVTPPPGNPPPVTPPPGNPPPVTPPPLGTPPPPHHWHAPPPPATVPELPHTGAAVLGLAGAGAGTMLAGAGFMALARRRSGSGS